VNSQYKFNPEDLNFNKLDNRFRVRFWRFISYIFAALFTAFILNILYIVLFDSPSERMVRNENEELMKQYQVLQERKAMVDTVFNEIKRADENIFRLIFETEPARSNIEESGFIPYEHLKDFSDRQIVMFSAFRLDSLLKKTRYEKLDYDILRIKSGDKAEMLKYVPAIQPIENKDLTRTASGFGYRLHPIYKIVKFHQGMDYTAPIGTQVYATGDGTVEQVVRSRRGSGNKVVISHGYGFKTVYAHLNDINVRQGREVSRGDVIGTVGNSGLSAGPHLHYEVLFNGEAVNPVNFFFLELDPEAYDRMIMISKNSGQSFD
jgi:murein DD-endopeptidase MepM/ murein hydrolase activator NlpD